ncbi:methylmalonyl-CoA mutase subunit beta [Winogradskyella maritima]|uniref:Methylmalonyl-CoA mutase subunit beta n=1 Tax=Winogradskyella maritima TaxID=1517766 RepID=A0ABV8AKE8_9FLAO|nr:methylmalonyl-CoA mutase subunit beta [Winogradskyella maritima]
MSKTLFDEFNPVSAKAWKQKIQVDLKGADYNDDLIWKTPEGIDVKPFYHSDDFESLPTPTNTKATRWSICQAIEVHDTNTANKEALDAINRGAESILFEVQSEDISISELCRNISEDIDIHIKFNGLSETIADACATLKNCILHTDIIGHLAETGNWYNNLKDDHAKFETIVSKTKTVSISLGLYQNAGATMVQQLAYSLAHANEYLNHFEQNGTKLEDVNFIFNVAVGSNYFFEISKLRALRQLWATLASEYNANEACQIFATPSRRNKTIYDYNVNMLRTTTECMSAILGGANTVCNLPYDALYHNPNEFGNRISRNQLLVLKNESYFDAVDNPSDGSYYIEKLTEQLAEKALDIFKSIEASGGFLSQLKDGTIQKKISESAREEQSEFNSGKLTLLGTNKHPNPQDKMKNDLEKSPFLKFEKRKTLIQPIIQKRLPESLEYKRLKDE